MTGKFRTVAAPQNHANVLWALTKMGASLDTVQPALIVLVPPIIQTAGSGECAVGNITQVVHAMDHYRMADARKQFLAGLPPDQLAAYCSGAATYKARKGTA